MIEAGKVLQNRYRVQKQIGQGGMGAVYVATDERFGSVVAIKETLVLEDHFRKAIEREARLLNSLKHPALPRVSDHFDDENGQFIVMEYIAGEDLSEMMERSNKAFLLEKVLNWADQLLDALDFLHNQEIPVIHRDIKPQNLKLTPRGQIILLDFGLAKGNPTDAAHQTAAKSIFGYSRNYASLEQIQGTGTDPRSDLYSLAATLYHLMTGIPPEDALTRAMHVLSGQPDTLKPANAVHIQIPRGVAAVLNNAMDLNSNQRPASAKEMRQMLREYEKYAHLVGEANANAVNTFAQMPHSTDLLARETKILPVAAQNQTDVQTQVLSEGFSQETKVKAAGADSDGKTANFYDTSKTAPERVKKRNLLGIAALVGLLLTVSGIAGTYFLKPEFLGFNSDANNSVETNNSTEAAVEISKPVNANVEEVNVQSAAADSAVNNAPNPAKTTTETVSKTDAPIKSKESVHEKNTAKVEKTKISADSDDIDLGGIKIKGDKVYVGNMIITDNQIKTPDGVINLDDEDMPEKPVIPRNFPGLSPEQFKNLTPKQRQKLRRIRSNQQIPSPPEVISPPKPPPY